MLIKKKSVVEETNEEYDEEDNIHNFVFISNWFISNSTKILSLKFYVKIYTGSMSILRINIVFFGPNMASLQLPLIFFNTKRLISPEGGFRGSNFDRFIF